MNKYTGPARPIPLRTRRAVVRYFTDDGRIARIVLLSFLIGALLYDLLIGRPG